MNVFKITKNKIVFNEIILRDLPSQWMRTVDLHTAAKYSIARVENEKTKRHNRALFNFKINKYLSFFFSLSTTWQLDFYKIKIILHCI